MPRERGFLSLTISKDWLQGYKNVNLSLVALYYAPNSQHTGSSFDGPVLLLETEYYAPPPKTKLPNTESLAIGLPVALGGCILIIAGVFFWNRKTRQIGLGSVMGRGKGYGAGKSRRQRMGIKKGDIMLQDRQALPISPQYRDDDEIRTMPGRQGQNNHGREESLGSLVSEEEHNAFRREMNTQRQVRY